MHYAEQVESAWISVVQSHCDCGVKFFLYDARNVELSLVKFCGNSSVKDG